MNLMHPISTLIRFVLLKSFMKSLSYLQTISLLNLFKNFVAMLNGYLVQTQMKFYRTSCSTYTIVEEDLFHSQKQNNPGADTNKPFLKQVAFLFSTNNPKNAKAWDARYKSTVALRLICVYNEAFRNIQFFYSEVSMRSFIAQSVIS